MFDLKGILDLGRININAAIDNAVLENKEPILRLNDAKLDKGVDVENKDLGVYKNYQYKNRFRPVDLLLTGDFRNTEDIIPDDTEMLYIDPDRKTFSLMSRYGENIIGAGEDDLPTIAQILQPSVINNLQGQLT